MVLTLHWAQYRFSRLEMLLYVVRTITVYVNFVPEAIHSKTSYFHIPVVDMPNDIILLS